MTVRRAVSLALLLVGCSSADAAPQTPHEPTAGGADPAPPSPRPVPTAGTLTRGDGGWLFASDAHPSAPATVPRDLERALDQLDMSPVSVVVSVERAPDGWALGEWFCVGAAEACAPSSPGVLWRAHGGEPDWSLTVTAAEASFRMPSVDPERLELITDEAGVLRLRSAEGASWRLELTHELCADSMADAYWPHSALLQRPDRTLRGCARPGA